MDNIIYSLVEKWNACDYVFKPFVFSLKYFDLLRPELVLARGRSIYREQKQKKIYNKQINLKKNQWKSSGERL